MVIAVLRLSLLIPEAASLKAKRKVLHALKDRVKSRFNVSIAEVGTLDLWQKSEIGVTAVGNDQRALNSKMDKLLNFIESTALVEPVSAALEFIHVNQSWSAQEWD
ncbi:MAG: DUF503 domain-containing protein [Deltaproteobacteria bacterium]|nr:DUF503 domain-containing protein [Deltaproteobacteria bacterium]